MNLAWSIRSRFCRGQHDATIVEHRPMISLIAIVAFARAIYFGPSRQVLFEGVRDDISAAIQ